MGFAKEKRPLLLPGGMEVAGGSTFTGAVTHSGAVTQSGTVTESGIGTLQDVQALTGASTGTTLTRYGITFITVASATESATAAQYRFRLPTPVAGATKVIAVDNATTRNVQIVAATSGATFYGATYNAIQWTTGSSGGQPVQLIGQDSTTWAVLTPAAPSGTTALPPRLIGVAT